jgi:hypothetical protein
VLQQQKNRPARMPDGGRNQDVFAGLAAQSCHFEHYY